MRIFGWFKRRSANPLEKKGGKWPTLVFFTKPRSRKRAKVDKLFLKFTAGNRDLHTKAEEANLYLGGLFQKEPDPRRLVCIADKETLKEAATSVRINLEFNRKFLVFLENEQAPKAAIDQLREQIALFESTLKVVSES